MSLAPLVPVLLAAAAATPASQTAVEPARYEIAFPNAAHHEAEITLTYTGVGPGTLELRMSRTSPGRYALHEFAKNVYDVRVTGVGGRRVEVERPDPHQWNVSGHGGEVRVRYTLFGDHADGTYTGIDRTHGHLNMPATFMWARGQEARPVELRVVAPPGSGWRVATQLAPTEDPYRFTAPDLVYFLDSPTEVSDFREIAWQVDGPSGPQTVRVALHHAGTDAEAEEYARAAERIVAAERGVFGELPEFDYGTYTFLACYLPWVDGDGMEHRNSTVLTSTGSLERTMVGLLGTVAHEFFHAWNVERIRPEDLEPFDFEAANMTDALWFAEGFTSYYTNVALWRAGLIDDEAFAARLGRSVGSVLHAPGRRYFPVTAMSMQAPFVDAAVSVDPQNRSNTFISYYTWGSVLGLGLDLEIRTRFPGLSLDDVMREMWRRHGVTEIPYEIADIEDALADVTDDPAFAAEFFERYVYASELPDFERLFAAAGFDFGPVSGGAPTLGPVSLEVVEDGLRVRGGTRVGSPLYEAGIDRGDVIHSVDGRALGGELGLDEALAGRTAGARVELRYTSRGQTFTRSATLAPAAAHEAGARPESALPAEQRAFRDAWRSAGGGR